MARMLILPMRFSVVDADRAYEEWGANCGPGAIAAVTGMTLDELRPYMGDFERKHYTNPTLMWEILDRLGVTWYRKDRPKTWPTYGLARIQWGGPWMKEPSAYAAQRHTHWVGVNGYMKNNIGIFDINAINNGTGWCMLEEWKNVVVPYITRECVPGAYGTWHITHSVEIVDVPNMGGKQNGI